MTQPEKKPSQPTPDSPPEKPLDLDGIPIPEMSLDDLVSPSSGSPIAESPEEAREELMEISVPDFSFDELLKDLGETRLPQSESVSEPTKKDLEPEIEVRLDVLDGLELPDLQLSESSGSPQFSSESRSPVEAQEKPGVSESVESMPIPDISLDDLAPPSPEENPQPAPENRPIETVPLSDLAQFDGIELPDVHLTEQPPTLPQVESLDVSESEPLGVESVPIPEMSLEDLELPQPTSAHESLPVPTEVKEPPITVSSLDLSGLDGVELPEARVFALGDEPEVSLRSGDRKEEPLPVSSVPEVSPLAPGIEDLLSGVEIVGAEVSKPGEAQRDAQEPEGVLETPPSVSEVSPLRRKSVLNPAQATTAFKSLFAQSDIPGILRLYEEQVDSRVKRQVVDWLVKHVEMLGVTPLLSVGSIETDEEMFRYMMRELLKLDRSAVCKQIEVETCPRPLLQVAVVLLSELGLRSALPKLQKCVEVGDAVVRSVALHGIGRSGEAAEPLVPLLLRTVELDSDKNVRLAAAKALQAMNTRKVYEAFEQKAHEVSLDPVVAHVLEELRAKFDPTGENRTRLRGGQGASKTDAKGTAKSAEKGSAHQGKAATLAIAVVVILAAAYFLFKRLTGQG